MPPMVSETPTPLEARTLTRLALLTLARHRNYVEEHDEINAGVACVFHGAARMGDVSPDEWAAFVARVNES